RNFGAEILKAHDCRKVEREPWRTSVRCHGCCKRLLEARVSPGSLRSLHRQAAFRPSPRFLARCQRICPLRSSSSNIDFQEKQAVSNRYWRETPTCRCGRRLRIDPWSREPSTSLGPTCT